MVLVPGRSLGKGDNGAVVGVDNWDPGSHARRRVRRHRGAGHAQRVRLLMVLLVLAREGIGMRSVHVVVNLLVLLLLSAHRGHKVKVRVRGAHQSSCGRCGRARVAASLATVVVANGSRSLGSDVKRRTAVRVDNGDGTRGRVGGGSGGGRRHRRGAGTLLLLGLVLLLRENRSENDLRELFACQWWEWIRYKLLVEIMCN